MSSPATHETTSAAQAAQSAQTLTLRYWAAAKAAAGGQATEQVQIEPSATVAEALALAAADRPELAKVIAASTFLIDGRTVERSAVVPAESTPGRGVVLEVLPPFAGG